VRQETADVPQAQQPAQHTSHEETPQQEGRNNKKILEKKLLDLEQKNIELQSQLNTKEALLQYVEDKMLKEQERHEEREDKLIDLVAEKSKEVGEITQKLLQLEAPKQEHVRDVTDAHVETHEPSPVRYINEQEQEY
jgi:hypothetical protein